MFGFCLLLLSSIICFLFKRWLGPLGILYIMSFFTIITIFVFIFLLEEVIKSDSIIYFDGGIFYFFLDFIEIHLICVFDVLSITMTLLVLIIFLLVQFFSIEYMYREAFLSRLMYLLNFFVLSVIILFIVYDYLLLLLAWEMVGLFSLLLVNFYYIRIYTLKAAFKTFLFARLSDFFILVPLLFFINIFHSTDFTVIFLELPFFLFYIIFIGNWGFSLLSVISFFIILAGCIKAAQLFFHTWLLDAMEAPTPASALIHSSTLVVMGIYIFIRFGIIFELSPSSSLLLAFWGGLTLLFGAINASFQSDLKRLVAYSTMSQMGYLCCGCGLLCFSDVILYLIFHAVFKAFLFIIVGYIVHLFKGNTDLSMISGLISIWPNFFYLSLFTVFGLAGLPLSAGFLTKELLMMQVFSNSLIVFFIKICWLTSIGFTILYFSLFLITVFFFSKSSIFISFFLLYYRGPQRINNFFNLPEYIFRQLLSTFGISRLSLWIYLFFFFFIQFAGEYLILLFSDIFLLIGNHRFSIFNNYLSFDISLLLSLRWLWMIKLWLSCYLLLVIKYIYVRVIL